MTKRNQNKKQKLFEYVNKKGIMQSEIGTQADIGKNYRHLKV